MVESEDEPTPTPHFDDLMDRPEPTRWERFKGHLFAPFTDWRYPLAFAIALLMLSITMGLVISLRGYGKILAEIDSRTEAAECVDLLESQFNSAVGNVIITLINTDDPEALDMMTDELREATRQAAVRSCYDLAG